MRKKLLFLLLFVFAAIPIIAAQTLKEFTYGDLKYIGDVEKKTCYTSSGNDKRPANNVSGHVYIPNKVYDGDDEYRVVGIGNRSFITCSGITSVTIENGVETIGEWAFNECTNLESVSIPQSVTDIQKGAFMYCLKLGEIDLPKGITAINDYVFDYTPIKSITIPEDVTRIGEFAFRAVPS